MVFTVLAVVFFRPRFARTKATHLLPFSYAGLAITAPSQGAGMQLHEAVELKEAYSVGNANAAVQEGWKLLAVVPGANGVTYVLGKPKEKTGTGLYGQPL
jgi:hypothetical protein